MYSPVLFDLSSTSCSTCFSFVIFAWPSVYSPLWKSQTAHSPWARCIPRPVATGRVCCICDWLRDATGLDFGNQSWICNAALVSVINFLIHFGSLMLINFFHFHSISHMPIHHYYHHFHLVNPNLFHSRLKSKNVCSTNPFHHTVAISLQWDLTSMAILQFLMLDCLMT